MPDTILLPTSYFPPVSWFALLLKHKNVLIEAYEHFPKQTWRNRCTVVMGEEPKQLVVPLRGRKDKTLTRDIRVDHSFPWQRTHWRTLEACYRGTPWFEYYEDDLLPLFSLREEFLVDLNQRILETLLSLLDIHLNTGFTQSYSVKGDFTDGRALLSKKTMAEPAGIFSWAAASGRKFHGNASVLDLMFYQGSKSREFIIPV